MIMSGVPNAEFGMGNGEWGIPKSAFQNPNSIYTALVLVD